MARKSHKQIEDPKSKNVRLIQLHMPKDLYLFFHTEAKRLAAEFGQPNKPFRANEVIMAVLASYHEKRAILELQIIPDD